MSIRSDVLKHLSEYGVVHCHAKVCKALWLSAVKSGMLMMHWSHAIPCYFS